MPTNRGQKKTFSEPILRSPMYPNGRGELFLKGEVSSVYQLRIWLPTEKKHLRRSLKTRDYDTAVLKAEEMINEIHGKVASGVKLFGMNLGQLVEKFIEWRQGDVDSGRITPQRLGTIRSQLAAMIRVKGTDLKLEELDQNSFFDWGQMRRRDNPTITNTTIRNETATINQMCEFSYREKYQTHIPKFLFRKLEKEDPAKMRRGIFTKKQYSDLTNFLTEWCYKKNCPDPEVRLHRENIRDLILILSNTAMRIGELLQLRWSDIRGIAPRVDSSGLKVKIAKIYISGDISKHGKERTIFTRGVEYFERVRAAREKDGLWIRPQDLVFPSKKGTRMDDRTFRPEWAEIMNGIGLGDYKQRKLHFYSLRHFAITTRLRDQSVFEVAKLSGTSSTYIDSHYGQPDEQDLIEGALKHTRFEDDGAINEVPW